MARPVSWGRRGAFLVLRQKGGDFTKLSGVAIRPALPEDAAALLDIYAPYVRETAITFEYEVPSLEEFRGRVEAVLHTHPYLVAEAEGEIAGYAYAAPFEDRAAYAHSAKSSIYIRRDRRGLGLGRRLYGALEAVFLAQNVFNLNAHVACMEKLLCRHPAQPDPFLSFPRLEPERMITIC